MSEGPSRRRLLELIGAGSMAALAGCGEDTDLAGTDVTSTTGTPGSTTTPQTTTDTQTTTTDTQTTTAEPQTPSDCDPTVITEHVETDTTWTASGCPRYALDANILVQNGATLTIEPGVEVVCRDGTNLTIKDDGTLQAIGTDSDPIRFYGETREAGHWQTLEVESDNANEMAHVVVQNGGYDDWAAVLVREGARLSITDSTIDTNQDWGLAFEDGATIPEFARNEFTENGRAGLRISSKLVGAVDSDSTYAGNNGEDHIHVVDAEVQTDATWSATDAPFFFTDTTQVYAGVTVEPGFHATFEEGGGIAIKESGGSMDIDASDRDTVVFEGAEDEAGHWKMLEFESDDSDNLLDNVEVRNGGYDDWPGVLVREDAGVSIAQSTFANNQTWGLAVESGANVRSLLVNEFLDNGDAGLRISAKEIDALDGRSTFSGNEHQYIQVNDASVQNDAIWTPEDVPFFFDDTSLIEARVTVEPGFHATIEEDGGIAVKENTGTLIADASGGDEITFEGATQQAGHWRTLEFESDDSDNLLDNVVVAHAGYDDWAAVLVRDTARATVRNSTIRDNADVGIKVERNGVFDGTNNTYQNNGQIGLDNRN